jgi:DNA repair protein SbcD/Mre11
MIKFFHTADSHFGVENYGKVDSKTGLHSRFLDFSKSFQSCVDQAIKNDIDFFLFCGDAYKTAYPTPTQQKYFIQSLMKLQQAKIPVVLIVGNHDHPLGFGKTHALDIFSSILLEGAIVFSKPATVKLETKNGPIQIVGIPWPTRQNLINKEEHHLKNSREITNYISKKVAQIVSSLASTLDQEIPSILAGHLSVSSGMFSGSEKCSILGNDPVLLPSQIALKPFDYIALGHLHRHQVLNKNSYPKIVYSGSTERIDFGERQEEKGFCKVIIDTKKSWGNSKRCLHEFIKLHSRQMIQIDIKLERGNDQTDQIIQEINKRDIENSILKIIYHVPIGAQNLVEVCKVQRACSKAHYIASITPIIPTNRNPQRVKVQSSMKFEEIVAKFLDSKENIDNKRKKNLQDKAHELYEKFNQPEEPEKKKTDKQNQIIL